MKIKLLLVDDHKMMRDGLRSMLERDGSVEVVGEAPDGRTAINRVRELQPDVVVMDVGMPDLNGIEATTQVKANDPDVKVIALSTYSDKRYVTNMLRAGASGYVLKEAAGDDLLRAVQAVTQNKSYLSPEITGVVVDAYINRKAPTEISAYSVLGSREREVLQLLAEGKTSARIAAALHIAPKTVETHRRNITKKLGLKSIAELVKYAVREGLTPLE